MEHNRYKLLGVTLAFVGMAVSITAFLWAVSAAGFEIAPGHTAENWGVQGLYVIGYAVVAGLMVDLFRWAAEYVYRNKPDYRLRSARVRGSVRTA